MVFTVEYQYFMAAEKRNGGAVGPTRRRRKREFGRRYGRVASHS